MHPGRDQRPESAGNHRLNHDDEGSDLVHHLKGLDPSLQRTSRFKRLRYVGGMGQATAFEDYVRAHQRDLVRLAYVLTGDESWAEELTQAVLVKAFLRWRRIARSGSPHAYVRRMLINFNLDRIRSEGRHCVAERKLVASAETEMPDTIQEVIDRQALNGALQQLSATMRAILVLTFYMDLSDTEISECIGLKESSVRASRSRALETLRQRVTVLELGEIHEAG